jgi:hypothetical protein
MARASSQKRRFAVRRVKPTRRWQSTVVVSAHRRSLLVAALGFTLLRTRRPRTPPPPLPGSPPGPASATSSPGCTARATTSNSRSTTSAGGGRRSTSAGWSTQPRAPRRPRGSRLRGAQCNARRLTLCARPRPEPPRRAFSLPAYPRRATDPHDSDASGMTKPGRWFGKSS